MLKPDNSVCFNKVFGNEKILINFINSVTRRTGVTEVTKVTTLNTELDHLDLFNKVCFPNVLCECQNRTQFIVEVQILLPVPFEERVQFHASRILSNQLQKSSKPKFTELKPVVLIILCSFNLLDNERPYSVHRTVDIETGEQKFNLIEYVVLQLNGFDIKSAVIPDLRMEELWMYFFASGDEMLDDGKLEAIRKRNESVYDAIKLLNEANWSDEEKKQYEAVEKADLDTQNCIVGAFNDGKSRGRAKIAERMLRGRVPREQIKKFTLCSDEEIDSLADELCVPRPT